MAASVVGTFVLRYYRHIVSLLDTNAELKKTAEGIFQQMTFAAGGTLVGGILGGPLGAMAGGLIGSYLGYRTVHNYNSMVKVIRNLSNAEREELVWKVQNLVGSVGLDALTTFLKKQVNRKSFLDLIYEFANQASNTGC